MTRHRSETYEHTINGLLAKRGEMNEEIAATRERLAELSNDIEALDRVLERLGYDGEISLTPRAPRIVLFYRNELRHYLLAALKEHGPQTSRALAQKLITTEGKDHRDRRMMVDVTKRISKALRMMRDARLVTSGKAANEYVWKAT